MVENFETPGNLTNHLITHNLTTQKLLMLDFIVSPFSFSYVKQTR